MRHNDAAEQQEEAQEQEQEQEQDNSQNVFDEMDEATRVFIQDLLNSGRAITTLNWDQNNDAAAAANDDEAAQDGANESDDPDNSEDEDREGGVDDGGNIDNAIGNAVHPNDPTAHFVWVADRRDAVEETNKCPACDEDVAQEEIVYLACGHVWCSDCLNNSIRVGLSQRTNYPPRCCRATPDGIDMAVVQGFLADDVLIRLLEVGEEFSIPDPTYCSDPRCSAFINPVEGEQWGTCAQCHKITCMECKADKEKHVDGAENHPDLISKEDKKLGEEQGWKQCPNRKCQKLIARADGCDHMQCECGTHFCYQCGRHLDPHDGVNGMACNCRGQNPWLGGVQQWATGGRPGPIGAPNDDGDSDSDSDSNEEGEEENDEVSGNDGDADNNAENDEA